MSAADVPRHAAAPPRGEVLVGRELEIQELEGLLAEAKEGRGHLVFVTGEAGIGKSALANELLRRARQDPGVTVARGRCVVHYGTGEAYLPILDALSALLAGPGRERALEVLRAYAPSWALQIPAAAPTPEILEALKRQTVGVTRERMLREVVDFVTAATTETFPALLLLEDLQWADPSSIEAVRAMASRMARLPILTVATFRPSEVELTGHPVRACRLELAGQAHVHEMPLGLLTRGDVRRYLDLRFVPHEFPSELPAFIHDRTEGHPLFVANFVDFLCTRGDVASHDGHWTLRRPVAEGVHDVPENLLAIIRHKVDALAEADRQALQCAAVIGLDFLSTVLAELLNEDEMATEERLQRLARVRLVEHRGEEELPDGTSATQYRFAHSLYQEVLYEDLVRSRRVTLHLRAGKALLLHYRDQAPRIASALALHFEKGRDFASAVEHRIQAGDNAARLYAYAEALENYDQAVLLVEKLPEPERPVPFLALHQKRGAVQFAFGRFDRAVVDFTLMRMRAQAAGELVQEGAALTGLCNALFFARRIEEMAVRAHEALGVAAQGGGEALRVQAMVHVAQILEAEGRLNETMSLLDDVIAIARRIGHEWALMAALAYRGTVLYWKSQYGPAEEQFVEGAEAAARVRDGFAFLCCRMFRDLCRARLGRISEALAGFEETTETARRNGDRYWLPRLLAHQGWVRREIQVFDGAAAFSEEALRIARENPLPAALEMEALMNLSIDYARAGRTAESERMLQELEESGPTSMVRWLDELRLRMTSAEHWLVRGDARAAREHAQGLLELGKKLEASMYPSAARKLLSEIALADGRPGDAVVEATAALEGLRERPAPLEAWRILSTLARARLALGEAAAARAAFREAQAVVSSLAAGIQQERLRAAFLGSPAVREVIAGANRPD